MSTVIKKREVLKELKFEHGKGEDAAFDAISQARQWCTDNGYSYGSMARDMPIALMKGDFMISKWYNLSRTEQMEVDGLMTCGQSFREGPVFIQIFK